MTSTPTAIAYLGPEGTYAHLVARTRYGLDIQHVPMPSIPHVFEYVASNTDVLGIVPIENSSGGTIYETVDLLVSHAPHVAIREELAVNVKLALLGHDMNSINIIYSHFAPLNHCGAWLKERFPGAELRETRSTAEAAIETSKNPSAAALGSRLLSELYPLRILEYPVMDDVVNVTHFFALGRPATTPIPAKRTGLLVRLLNQPGSLCTFLEPFRERHVNLTRIVSRPIPRQPQTYVFFVEIEGSVLEEGKTKTVLAEASKAADTIHVLGSYPIVSAYDS